MRETKVISRKISILYYCIVKMLERPYGILWCQLDVGL